MKIRGLIWTAKEFLKRTRLAYRLVEESYKLLNFYRNRKSYYLSKANFLKGLSFDQVLFSERGNSQTIRTRRLNKFKHLKGQRILILGCGDGDNLNVYRSYSPSKIIATDVLCYPEEWNNLQQDRTYVFASADAFQLPFKDGSFDIIASDAVFEHLYDVETATQEMHRVLKPDGITFAAFGPLWYCSGGAHYGGSYEHLLMEHEEFRNWLVERDLQSEKEGLFYLEHGMFSRWTFDQYATCFDKYFETLYSIVHVSAKAMQFRKQRSEEFGELLQRFPEQDLLTKAITIYLRKK